MQIVKSEKLEGREILVCKDKSEARQAWVDNPNNRGGIYLSSEVLAMQGKEVDIHMMQDIKDLFPGAIIEKVEAK